MTDPSPLRLHFRFMAPRLMDIRTRLPAAALAAAPGVEASEGADLSLSSVGADVPKLLIHQRVKLASWQDWVSSTATMIRQGWISVAETDDLPRDLSDEGMRYFSCVHAIQTSTPRLAEVLRPHNPNLAVFPNAVFDLPPLPDPEGPPRIFYGAVLRGPIAVEVAASLAPVVEAFPQAAFVVVGDLEVFNALPTQNKTFHDYLPYDDYQTLMRTCRICLSPLAPGLQSECKSDAKFLDAARNGLVMVASPTVYRDSIVEGRTGFVATGLADWSEILLRVLSDAPLRERVRREAYDYVRDHRMFARQIPTRLDWYRSLWDRRNVLTRQLVDRVPGLRRELGI